MNAATRYAIYGHRRVQGWMEPQVLSLVNSLAAAQVEAGVAGGIAEIGVHHGKLFLGLHLARQPGERSVAIDLFADQSRNVDGSGRGDEETFRINLDRHADGANAVSIMSADSTTLSGDAVRDIVGGVRLFSVDGGHTAEIVESDMRVATDSLVPGGIIIADDVFNMQWPGVVEGTLRFLDTSTDVVPFALGFNKVLFTQPSYVPQYQYIVQAAATARLWEHKTTEMRGHAVVVTWSAGVRQRSRKAVKRLLRS